MDNPVSMPLSKRQTFLRWLLLVVISTSISGYTFHSHNRPWKHWNNPQQQPTNGQITPDYNLCPVDGYLFGANVAPSVHYAGFIQAITCLTIWYPSAYHAPFNGPLTGRSPPLID